MEGLFAWQVWVPGPDPFGPIGEIVNNVLSASTLCINP